MPIKKQIQKEWRVIFIVYAYIKKDSGRGGPGDDMTIHLNDFLKTLLKSPVSEQNSYCLLLNKVTENPDKKESPLYGLPGMTSEFDVTVLYELVKNSSKQAVFVKLKEFKTIKLAQKPAEIAKVLSTINATRSLNAKRTMIVTWDHGSVFGIFPRSRKEKIEKLITQAANNNVTKALKAVNIDQVLKKYYVPPRLNTFYRHWDDSFKSAVPGLLPKGISILEENYGNSILPVNLTFDLLYNEDLANAIKKGLGCKVDIMLMANCYMQNMHTASAFKEIINILIAPQGDLEYPCYDFKSLITRLEADPLISNSQLSEYIVKSTANFFPEDIKNKLSLFATDLAIVNRIETEISSIANYFIKAIDKNNQIPGFKLIFQNVLRSCYQFDAGRNYFSIDLANLLYQLRIFEFDDPNDPRISGFEEMLNQVSDFILTTWVLANDYIIAKHTGVNFTAYGPPHGSAFDKNILPKAVSIYAPDQSGFQNFPEIQYIAFRTLLFKITTWDDFLDKINR